MALEDKPAPSLAYGEGARAGTPGYNPSAKDPFLANCQINWLIVVSSPHRLMR